MSAGGKEYTLFFAWVPQGTAWDISLARFDENIFDLLIEHDEGQIPTAALEIKNPRIGFLNPGRLFWAWISFSIEACPPQPLFYGRLVGIPEELAANTVKMKFIARSDTYVYQKQQVARSLKVLPNYDPIFFEVAKRDDPDAILEGWSALYHVDRVNNRVSASDILVGEDGTVHFAEQDVFYDSVRCKLLQSPLVAVNVKAEVQWEQQFRDQFLVGQWAWPTLGNDAFVQDWPKSGTSLGGGWYAGISWAGERDPLGVAGAFAAQQKPAQLTVSITVTNKSATHSIGDTMSTSLNYTTPFGNQILIRQVDQIGIVDPGDIDQGGIVPPTNIPAHVEMDWFCYEDFALDFLGKQSVAMLTLTYEANRKRTERLEMTVTADVQPILIDPLLVEDTEQITLKSGDLSLPLIDLQNWDSVGFGGHVALGDFIYPDNPLVPGQTSSQVAVQSGHTGNVFPTFSNIAGDTTNDGTVIWASLGDTPPTEGAQDWQRLAFISLGTLLIPKPISGVPDFSSVTIPGSLNYPPTGTAVPVYSVFSLTNNGGPGALMQECTVSGFVGGFTGTPVPGFPSIPVAPPAAFQQFTNPTGAVMYIAVQAGQTAEFHTTFDETKGNQTADGSVIWQCIGRVHLPIGGWPGQTPAAAYFPRNRGLQSLEHMFCRARAKLRKRARAVEVSFDTRFEAVAQLSCRMNGRILDARLPGGAASGKVISYKLEAHGDTGVLIGKVVLGCSVGHQPLPLTSPAAPLPSLSGPGLSSYVVSGYAQGGYMQQFSSISGDPSGLPATLGVSFFSPQTPPLWPTLPPTLPPESCPPLDSVWTPGPIELTGDEMSYTPPVHQSNDDGIHFPASPNDLMLRQQWHGIASTMNPGNLALYNLQLQIVINNAIIQALSTTGGAVNTPSSSASVSISVNAPNPQAITAAVQSAVVQSMLQGTGLWYELVLKPLTNGPFQNSYVISTSPLIIPQTIDLSA